MAQSVASQLSTRLEETTDAFAAKCNEAAVAENEYLRAYSIAYAEAAVLNVPATIRAKHCDNVPAVVEAKTAFNLAAAAEKAARAKWEEVRHRLMAALSHQRFVREATGG